MSPVDGQTQPGVTTGERQRRTWAVGGDQAAVPDVRILPHRSACAILALCQRRQTRKRPNAVQSQKSSRLKATGLQPWIGLWLPRSPPAVGPSPPSVERPCAQNLVPAGPVLKYTLPKTFTPRTLYRAIIYFAHRGFCAPFFGVGEG
jgi:hypothetical protein